MRKPLIAACSLALATGCLFGGAARADTAPPHASEQVVITNINGQLYTNSDKWQRMAVMGPDDNARPPDQSSTTYAVVDTAKARLVSRMRTNGTIEIATVDDQRGLLYMVVSTLPTRVTGAGTSYHLDLWCVDLRSGQLRWHKLFYEGEAETVAGMTVDPASGHVFMATIRQGSGTYELSMIEPSTMKVQIQSLDGIPDHVFSDPVHHRIVVSEQTGADQALVTNLVAFDAGNEAHVWTHKFQYIASTYAAFDVQYDPRTLQAWILAPGGLVTQLNIGSGRITRNIPMGYQRSTDWKQTNFAVDLHDNRSYAAWVGGLTANGTATNCHIDLTNNTPARKTFVSYNDPCGQQNASLLMVDQFNGWIVTADTNALHVFDNNQGKEIKTWGLTDASGQGSTWNTAAPIAVNGHMSVAFVAEVHHQNDATGALITGAVTFVPIS